MLITRRRLSLLLLAAAGGSAWYWSRTQRDGSALDLDLPEATASGYPSYEVFLALSKIVTCRDRLDETIARRLYTVFLDEPWGAEHVESTYRTLKSGVIAGGVACADTPAVETARLTSGEAWFVTHLLTTWYTGIYYHDKRPTQRICWEQALMYDAVRDVIPVWFVGTREDEYWTTPPQAKKT